MPINAYSLEVHRNSSVLIVFPFSIFFMNSIFGFGLNVGCNQACSFFPVILKVHVLQFNDLEFLVTFY